MPLAFASCLLGCKAFRQPCHSMGSHEHFQGEEDAKTCLTSAFPALLVPAHSMDMTNDPRFFTDNVLNKRLMAFSGLSVVSGLLVQNAMDQLFDMNKNMIAYEKGRINIDGALQLASFCILVWILFSVMLATYIGVAQPYYTYRLMTAGPTGFDAAAAFYLNKNVVAWRHLCIKTLLASLPLYMVQMGFRLNVKFDRSTRAAEDPPKDTPFVEELLGWIFCGVFMLFAIVMCYAVRLHARVFRERYKSIALMPHLTKYMQQRMMSTSMRGQDQGFDVDV